MHPNDPQLPPATERQRLAASPDARDEVRLERTKEFEAFGSDGTEELRTQLIDARSGRDEARGECERLRAEIERWRDSNIRLRDEVEHQAKRANEAEWDRDAIKAKKEP